MKTAVEWYNEQLNLYGDMAFNKEISLGQYHIKKQELLEQAKEMEKEQKGYSEKDIRNAIDMAQDWKSIVRSRGNEWIEFKYTHQEIINKIHNL
jgi:hypothetical protein